MNPSTETVCVSTIRRHFQSSSMSSEGERNIRAPQVQNGVSIDPAGDSASIGGSIMFTNGSCDHTARCAALLILVGFSRLFVHAQVPLNQRVLVVYNSTVPASVSVANYYATQRVIPTSNLCPISPPSTGSLSWSQYVASVKTPVQNCLNTVGAKNILYIVFTYQTPYSISAGSTIYATKKRCSHT